MHYLTLDRYYTSLVHYLNSIMHTQLVFKYYLITECQHYYLGLVGGVCNSRVYL